MHLNTDQLSLSEYARNQHTLIVTVDQPLEDIMRPSAWAHIANKIKPRDRIEVIASITSNSVVSSKIEISSEPEDM